MLTNYSQGPYEIRPYNTATSGMSSGYRIWDKVGKKWVGPNLGLEALNRVLRWLNGWPNQPRLLGEGLPIVKTSELQLGDEVIPYHGAHEGWDTQIVKGYDEPRKMFKLYRPYGTYNNLTVVGPNIICYMGLEEYEVFEDSDAQWFLCHRSTLK